MEPISTSPQRIGVSEVAGHSWANKKLFSPQKLERPHAPADYESANVENVRKCQKPKNKTNL